MRKQKSRRDTFYVVTRAGRRIEEKNYWTYKEAEKRASQLRGCLRAWNDRDFNKVEILKTADPGDIY